MKVKLGQKVKDKITGFAGIVTARAEYLTGCEQLLVQPAMKGEDFVESRWFDVDRVDVIEEKPVELTVTKAGFDKAAPRR